MIDLGNPFSRPFQDLITSLETSIREGVEQPAVDEFVFQSSVTSYELRLTAHAVSRVSGLLGGSVFTVFQPEVHFRLSNNRILWLHPTEKPLDGGRLTVEYTYRERPSGLTDFNPGSVLGTLVRAIAREMKLLYEQMDQAYQRAFIDHANGVALDNVVALLGIERNKAVSAEGFVTFFRKKAPDVAYPIPVGTRVTDESGRTFATVAAGVIAPDIVEEFLTPVSGALTALRRIASLAGVWGPADDPNLPPTVPTLPTAARLPFGESEREITLDLSGGPPPAGELRVRYVAKSITLPVAAVEPGPEGNVNAGTIIIMPTPPTGIQGVINEEPVTGGKAPETDELLRERARFHLERKGRATLNAIKFAVLEVDDVEGVEVIDHTGDSTIPLGEVHINVSGGDVAEVMTVVEDTRAAGILPVLSSIVPVLIAGGIYVLPDVAVPVSAVDSFRNAVLEAIKALEIGKPLSTRKLTALVYSIPGLADTAEAQLTSSGLPIPDPLVITRTQLIRPDEANLNVILLTALNVSAVNRIAPTNTLDLQMNTASGPASFNQFALDLTLKFKARLQTAPDQVPTFIGAMTRRITFTSSATASLSFTDAEIPGYNPADHDPQLEIEITATAYPGLAAARPLINLV